MLLGNYRKRRARSRHPQNRRHRSAVFRLRGARRAVRTRRRHPCTVGVGGVAAVRTRNRTARAPPLHSSGQDDRVQLLRLQSIFQSLPPWKLQQSLWLVGLTVAFRAQSRADCVDDRKLSYGIVMATDAKVPISCRRLAASGFHGRLAVKGSVTFGDRPRCLGCVRER